MGLEVSFLFWGRGRGGGGDFCVLVWNFILLLLFFFLSTGLGPSDLSFFLSVWSPEVEFFRVHRNSLSRRASRFRQKNKTKQYVGGLVLVFNVLETCRVYLLTIYIGIFRFIKKFIERFF